MALSYLSFSATRRPAGIGRPPILLGLQKKRAHRAPSGRPKAQKSEVGPTLSSPISAPFVFPPVETFGRSPFPAIFMDDHPGFGWIAVTLRDVPADVA